LAKIEDRSAVLWPKWSPMVVQLERCDTHSHKVKPSYAVVLAPPSDLAVEPTSIVLPKISAGLISKQRIHMRCTESNCPYRKTKVDPADAQAIGQHDEIHTDDQVNIMDSMLGEADEIDEAQTMQDPACMQELAETSQDASPRHDCIVNLWPYAHPTTYYQEVLTALGSADKASVAIVLLKTAHLAHWMVCASNLQLDKYVLTRRWSDHSTSHGFNLGRQLLTAVIRTALGGAGAPVTVPQAPEKLCQFIEGVVLTSRLQVIEAYEVSQGSSWHDGLNRSIPGDAVATNSARLIGQEA
jgi:hypothetical protein